jgi:crotonobetaine/carnitine-CoA ligase
MELTIGETLRERALAQPDVDFVRCGGPWLTVGTLDRITDRLAAGLAASGVAKGDRVVVLMPNRQEMLELIFALAKLGAIQVPLNFWLKGEFLRYQLEDCGARVIVVDAEGFLSASPFISSTDIRQIIVVDQVDPAVTDDEVIRYAAVRDSAAELPDVSVSQHDIASILYTSGTTGMPKGCMLSHGQYIQNASAYGDSNWVIPGDRMFTAYQLFHTSGQVIALMGALVCGASICFEKDFHASTFMARAREEQATVLCGVGPMGMAILAQPESPDDASRQFRMSSWIPMEPDDQARFGERFNSEVMSEGYGQTECSPVTTSRVSGKRKRTSAGMPVSFLEVKLLDDDDREVPVGTIGEIAMRPLKPDVIFVGYWRKPEATLEAFRSLWYHTGDCGVADEDGFITFVDRKKDALRRRGENVSSFQLEASLCQHPAIVRAAVCGLPSPLGEDDIKATLVCEPGVDRPDPVELFDFMKGNLPFFAIPRYVEFRDDLPSTAATGRVMKFLLREEGVTGTTIDLEALGLIVPPEERRG